MFKSLPITPLRASRPFFSSLCPLRRSRCLARVHISGIVLLPPLDSRRNAAAILLYLPSVLRILQSLCAPCRHNSYRSPLSKPLNLRKNSAMWMAISCRAAGSRGDMAGRRRVLRLFSGCASCGVWWWMRYVSGR